ncbi:2-amino-4-hydroxy-6-hydroxymethyldihydropteridine diphosphokinase [Roseibium porphyridii]|uniref:2-amino-4-hydroxy-6-hydroxymethyldihydropteridine pyrophosphokinase n=1 Tax=Roseibium porphyridii TaxID=2866279 RepID=A0ABY8F521_9HYPH|nr:MULTISPECIES: 2-amino-4-hydroxy-6-hydroxymethyldihydropteridine diphosphokinase [Stappiaceae]QFT29738.1 Bifunctional folate synthesis protein [Labrenzia sp. THAF82]WFE90466.1 2-amino-4-hydroxy-6-hydroxymethyldihydropteridine diphosphokinase [Roseibium sp. KMA01]
MPISKKSPLAPTRCALGLGSNLGDPQANLENAVQLLDRTNGITVVTRSSDYRTPPWGPVPQDDYVNICLVVDTTLSPQDLLKRCLETEAELGRVRDIRWGPRKIDIDVLIYGLEKVEETDLEIPHPRMGDRAFVLIPLSEIWPDAPLGDGRTAAEALETCPDQEGVVKLD